MPKGRNPRNPVQRSKQQRRATETRSPVRVTFEVWDARKNRLVRMSGRMDRVGDRAMKREYIDPAALA